MYSLVLMAAMTTTPETAGFGDTWAKHCFWESCLPARYGWVACGPGYHAYYPASYTSCCGFGGGHSFHHHNSCHGCYSSCHGCWGQGHGCWGQGYGGGCGSNHACGGGYYNCYGGGGQNIFSGIGYAGFGAYGNFGNYGTVPVYGAPYAIPNYGTPVQAEPRMIEARPADVKPIEVKPIEIKPIEIKPLKTQAEPAKAAVIVRVPNGAKVYIDGNLMHSTAAERTFTTPAIEPGSNFYYTVRVVVEQNGKPVEDIRKVSVRAGEISRPDFDNLFDRIRPDDRTIVDSNRNPVK